MTARQWHEDLHSLVGSLLLTHCDLFHQVDRNDFCRHVRALEERLPRLAGHEMVTELSRLVALVGDGHTAVSLTDIAEFHRYPLRLYWYADGLCVQVIAHEYADAAGARLVSINRMPVDEACARVRPLIARDNEMGVTKITPTLLVIPEVLHACGVTGMADAIDFMFERADGQLMPCNLGALDRVPEDLVEMRTLANPPTPLWLTQSNRPNWFKYVAERRLLYVQHNVVRDAPDEPLSAFWDNVFAFGDSEDVDCLVLDIRRNGGGNLTLNQALVHHLIRCGHLNRWGRLFAIIGRETFSAAMNLATDLERETRTLFVGELTGSSPNHFGENGPISLPHSGLHATAAMYWYQHSDPRDHRPWIEPDLPAPLRSADYAANRDPAMDAIQHYSLRPEHEVDYPARLYR